MDNHLSCKYAKATFIQLISFSIAAVKAYYNSGKPDLLMTDHFLKFISSIAMATILIWTFSTMTVVTANSLIQKSMSENVSTLTLGSPIYISHDKVRNPIEVDVNGSKALLSSFSGNATIKGISIIEVGTSLVIFRPDGAADVKGQAVMTAKDDNSKVKTTFYGISYSAPNGTTVSNGAAFLHTTSSSSTITNGKLDSINNLVIIFKSQADKFRNLKITGWEWK